MLDGGYAHAVINKAFWNVLRLSVCSPVERNILKGERQMKALVYFGPEDIRYTEVNDLKPENNEVLIRVKATGICGSDVHGYLGITGRRIPPMIMGHEFSGDIVEIGKNVKEFSVGEKVTVQPVNFCGECEFCKNGLTNMCINKRFFGVLDVNGSMAEYVCVPDKLVCRLPASLSYIQGAMVEPLAVAYSGVKQAPPIEGKNVLIIGAGTIGLLVLQVVKMKNPAKIFITDLSDHRLEVAKKLGADVIINPSKENVEETVKAQTKGNGADVALEAVGVSQTVQQAMSSLKVGGTCVWIGNSQKMININMQEIVTRELKIFGTYIYTHEEFKEAIHIISSGEVDVEQIISKRVLLAEGPEMFQKLAKDADKLIKVIIEN
jgi:2-desacetyl-2-hydroxyethyl bacteriochlorophyllide A dehydrogenase